MNPSHRRLKLTDAPSDPMVPAASVGGVPLSSDGKASGDRPAQVMSAIRRPNGHRDQMTGPERNARFPSVVLPHLADGYALARWLTGNSADAEDVVQDACLHAFRGIGNFSGGNARAWVLTIVRHTAYTWLGKNRPAALVLTEDLEAVERAEFSRGGGAAAAAGETTEAALIAKADEERLEAAIQKLPPPFRETLVLRD